ncbi:MAG TPA: hypothetical protein PKB10_02075, partial [Tepidisphaeraceae bacterium]|nr:hypothetical protein [Tepidisphaeraceae bacterium]
MSISHRAEAGVDSHPTAAPAHRWVCISTIIARAVLLAGTAYHAGASRSPTFGEPLHLVGAMTQSAKQDYRHNFADPPLWKHWIALALPAMPLPTGDPRWTQMPERYPDEWSFAWLTLYGQSVDPTPAFRRGQRMIAPVAGAPVIAAGAVPGQLAGPIAGAIAAGLIAVCPTTIALGGIIKNDVPITLAFVLVAFAGWSVGRRLTIPRVLLLGAACGIAATTKFSGVLTAPIVASLLLARTLISADWPTSRQPLRSIGTRLIGAMASGVVVALVMIAIVWASYGFRYRAVPEADRPLALRALATEAVRQREQLKYIHKPFPTDQAAALPYDRFSRLVLWIDRHRLLPEAFNAGLLYVHAFSAMRDSFALGEVRSSGTWWYFPFAILAKSPLALLAAWLVGGALLINRLRHARDPSMLWNALVLGIVIAVLAFTLLTARLNIGVRHALPLMTLLSIAAAGGLAWLARRRDPA